MYRFGRLLSAVVAQNVPILIAVGLIRALFGVYGWVPHDTANLFVGPLLNWLVPVLFAYTGGQLMGGRRGGHAAAIAAFGLALASSVSMIFVALLLGPVVGWMVSRIDRMLENRIPPGYELLMANFVPAVLAGTLALLCFLFVGQTVSSVILRVNRIILDVAYSGWLPVAALLVEPAKALFLNNVMSYGILAPLGISQVRDLGKSIFFLVESNPGPALGMLLAYWIRTRGKQRAHVRSTLAIHSLGGIQEVYFPYVLMNPLLLLPLIAGNMAGIFWFQYWNAGLVSIPSPPSVLLIAGMAPPDDILFVVAGMALSAAVSMPLTLLLWKAKASMPVTVVESREPSVMKRLENLQLWGEVRSALRPAFRILPAGRQAVRESSDSPDPGDKSDSGGSPDHGDPGDGSDPGNPGVGSDPGDFGGETSGDDRARPVAAGRDGSVRTVCFACDAGMGSSAMGAAILRKKVRAAGLGDRVKVVHASLDEIPAEADLIVTHRYFLHRAMSRAPGRIFISLENYTDTEAYDTILAQLKLQMDKSSSPRLHPGRDDRGKNVEDQAQYPAAADPAALSGDG